ncbi:MAG: RNA polymerase sigma factor [Candidatus Aminicenantes bacterium]
MNDTDIMSAVKKGQVEKLAVLFEKHHLKLFNFFWRLTGNRNVSEDLVQDVFIRILKYRSTYNGNSRFSFWMFQIARNAHYDFLRKHKNQNHYSLDDQWRETTSRVDSPQDQTVLGQEIDLLQQALSKLPVRKREVLLLSRFQGMKYKEIAELMDCRIGTVKGHVHRAMKELRKIYGELAKETAT